MLKRHKQERFQEYQLKNLQRKNKKWYNKVKGEKNMKYKTIEEVLEGIGEDVVARLDKDNLSKEEKAFLLGNLNVIASVTNPEQPHVIRICLNYDKVKALYEEANMPKEQISLEELFPDLFEALDKHIESKLKKKKSNKTEE
jgi:hypothetical protein